MKYVDRFIWTVIVLVVGMVTVQSAVRSIVTVTIVGTLAFIAIKLTVYFTRRW
jgi:hypothetical protein